MYLSTHCYVPTSGWSRPLDPSQDSPVTLLVVFGAPEPAQLREGFADLRSAFPKAVWIGCSSSGEIFDSRISDDTLVVAVVRFSRTALRLASREISDPDASLEAGSALGSALSAADLKAVFVLSDGLGVNGSKLVEGLSESLPPGVVVTGGLAGDGDRFKNTWVLVNGEPRARHVTAVGFYGDDVRVAYGSKGGLDVLGLDREVTGSRGNVLYSLDGQPALPLYKKYLGERAAGLPATGLLFPLAISNDADDDGHTVRTILAVNETDDSITFAGDIPQGSRVRLMRANADHLIDGAGDAARSAGLEDYIDGTPMLGLGVSCVGRRLVLGQRTEEEIEAVIDALPDACQLVGYYSYGELSPLRSGRCDLHNQTMTLSLIWEV